MSEKSLKEKINEQMLRGQDKEKERIIEEVYQGLREKNIYNIWDEKELKRKIEEYYERLKEE